ncbi:4Fe-4S dicluster domain-containing protein [Pseudodesulfovibrio cashew]|uniref:4Fe-4S dicluster domain-containing protein n=1 Tax=Pseudodesulfovibrio cashew TaxID=2678688 RepID=A0A6I6JJN3_9BACT|nr:4Fe-4S dicluster domain-containing protein [Pseudodesulfovibrio cashew]QGY41178.1 4Fe-4S dicluster domain-containing protein [Pseudodesulfovibrio cashew]
MKRVYPNKDYCIGCHLCELACVTAHSKSKDLIIAFREERGKDGLSPRKRVFESGDISVAISCRHCDEAACVAACIAGGLRKDPETGRTVYDRDRCVGCWSCLMACPYGAIRRHPLESKIVKCDLCEGREGGPACVAACPNQALKYEER